MVTCVVLCKCYSYDHLIAEKVKWQIQKIVKGWWGWVGCNPNLCQEKWGEVFEDPSMAKNDLFWKKFHQSRGCNPPPPLTPPHPSRSATEVSSYRGESEGMPLQTRDAGTMQEYVLPGAHLKPLLLHLQLIHFGWMMHHLRKHSTWLYRFKKMLHQKGIIIILVYI